MLEELQSSGPLEGVPGEEKVEGGKVKEKVVFVDIRERPPREFYISEKDCKLHGYTRGCPGCNSFMFGKGREPHSEGCRERFREILKGAKKV